MLKFILLAVIIFVSTACGFFIGQRSKSSASPEIAIVAEPKKPDFIKLIQSKNIKRLDSWEDDKGKKFLGVIRQLNEPCEKDSVLSSCQQFSIYDETGKIFYEFKDFAVDSVSASRFKTDSHQIVIQNNGGGTDDALTIVDYKDGKFTEMNVENDTSLRGGWWTMPEYRSGATAAYFKPSQLIVIQQIGGADPEPTASVFRFKENKFQKVGAIRMNELGDFIEKQIAVNK